MRATLTSALVLVGTATTVVGARRLRRRRAAGLAPWPAFVATVHELLPAPAAVLAVHEATILRSLWLALRRRDDGVGPDDRAFGYAAGAGLTTGALTTLTAVEVVLAHLLVPWPWVRTLLLVASLWGLVVVLGMWAGLRRHPHVVSADRLLLRAGPHVVVEVPWTLLAGLGRHVSHEPTSVKVVERRLHLPVNGSTRLVASLTEPLTVHLPFGRRADVVSIAFSADDPDALHAAALGVRGQA